MSYPSLNQNEGTKLVPRSGVRNRMASTGAVRQRALQSVTMYDPVIVHKLLNATDWATWKAFYDANRTGSFSVTMQQDGTTITCCFAEKPFDMVPTVDGGYRTVTAYLIQAG